MNATRRTFLAAALAWAGQARTARAAAPEVSFRQEKGRLLVRIGEQTFATYVHEDSVITRPYFCSVHAPGGLQVTRNHPPVKGKDAADHDTMHPGIWLAFGDLSGHDGWRNRAKVLHEKFVAEPRGGAGEGTFAVLNHHLSTNGKQVVARETCRFTIRVRPEGHLLLWDSAFSKGETDCIFGDQEEMGLGVRLATALTVKVGGRILNSAGKRNEREAWGKQADWCDYSGVLSGRRAGILLMPDPANFRQSWFHARDYGVLVANPFGKAAFTGGAKSRIAVKADEQLRLRFGILVYANADAAELAHARVYRDFLALLKDSPR